MRRSAPSIDPRPRSRGFTLIEVVVASSIFAAVLVLAYAQMAESTQATKQVTADADLRRIGEDVLARIGRDLRSTQSKFSSASASAIEFYRVVGFDPAAGTPLLEGGAAPNTVVYRYAQSAQTVAVNGVPMYGILEFGFGTVAQFQAGSVNKIPLSRELDLAPNGFAVSSSPSAFPPMLITTLGGPGVLADAPTTLNVRIRLRRRLGKRFAGELGAPGDWFSYATVQSQFELRPSKNY